MDFQSDFQVDFEKDILSFFKFDNVDFVFCNFKNYANSLKL